MGVSARAQAYGRWLVGDRFALWTLVLGLGFGVTFVFLIPPTQGADEPSHFLRAYSIAGGDVLAEEQDGHYGATLDDCVPAYLDGQLQRALDPAPLAPSRFDDVLLGCTGTEQFIIFDNTASYSPIAYALQVPGLVLGRAVGLSVGWSFYLGRLVGVVGFALVAAAAVRVSPRSKPALLVVALLPMSLTVAATYNADGVTLAAALLAAGTFLALRHGERRRTVLAVFAVALAVLCIVKPLYAVFTPLALMLPSSAFAGSGRFTLKRVSIGGLPVLAGAAWYVAMQQASEGVVPVGVDTGEQLETILRAPLAYLEVMLSVLLPSGGNTPFVDGFVMVFGWNRSGGAYWRPPVLIVVAGFVLLAHAYLRDAAGRAVDSARGLALALVPIGLAAVGTIGLLTIFYLTWTPVGAKGIDGLQGRYWLPLAVLPAVSMALLFRPRSDTGASARPFGVAAALLLATVTAKSVGIFY